MVIDRLYINQNVNRISNKQTLNLFAIKVMEKENLESHFLFNTHPLYKN